MGTEHAAHAVERTIQPRAPFDFRKSLDFICGFPATGDEQRIADGRLTKAFRVEGTTVVAEVVATGTPAKPELRCVLRSASKLSEAKVERALDRVRFYLSTDEDLGELYDLARSDHAFAEVVKSLHGYHQVKFPSPFENACWAVLAQRCAISVARTMKDRFVRELGGALVVDGSPCRTHGDIPLSSAFELHAFPEPADLKGVTEQTISTCIGNGLKAHRIRAVADAFSSVDDAFLRTAPSDEVCAWLQAIEGIGPWSANFVMVRGLGRMGAVAGIEESLLPAVTKIYGSSTKRSDVQRLAARYGSWQAYWAHYIRVAA